jgi:hypothetical protein
MSLSAESQALVSALEQNLRSRFTSRLLSLENTVRILVSTIDLLMVDPQSETFTFVAKDGVRVNVPTDLAIKSSDYFKALITTEMKGESGNQVIVDEDSKLLKIIAQYITLESLPGMICIDKLESEEAYQLMEMSTRMLLPKVCSNLAERIETFTVLDVHILEKATRQVDSCGEDFEKAWKVVRDKAIQQVALNIGRKENANIEAVGPLATLACVVKLIEDETWPAEYSNGPCAEGDSLPSPNDFFLQISRPQNDKEKINLSVHISKENQVLVPITDWTGGLFDYHVKADPDFQTEDKLVQFYSSHTIEFIKDEVTRRKYVHSVNPDSMYKVQFRARMLKLQRQSWALTKYAQHHSKEPGDNGQGSAKHFILNSLIYFHNIGSEDAKSFCSLLCEYASRSFMRWRDNEDSVKLPSVLVQCIIKNDILLETEEIRVLRFLIKWAIHQAEMNAGFDVENLEPKDSSQNADSAASSVSVKEVGVGQESTVHSCNHADKLKLVEDALVKLEFNNVLSLVRFPYIPWKKYDTINKKERLFLCSRDLFVTLFSEALACQMGSPAPGEAAVARRQKRTEYGDIPSVSVPDAANAMAVLYSKLQLVNSSSPVTKGA